MSLLNGFRFIGKGKTGQTPISEENLNKLIDAINDLDDRTQHMSADTDSTIINSKVFLDEAKTKDVVYDDGN